MLGALFIMSLNFSSVTELECQWQYRQDLAVAHIQVMFVGMEPANAQPAMPTEAVGMAQFAEELIDEIYATASTVPCGVQCCMSHLRPGSPVSALVDCGDVCCGRCLRNAAFRPAMAVRSVSRVFLPEH